MTFTLSRIITTAWLTGCNTPSTRGKCVVVDPRPYVIGLDIFAGGQYLSHSVWRSDWERHDEATKRAARGDWRDGASGEDEDRDDDVTVGRQFDCLLMLGSQAVACRIWYHRRQYIPVTEDHA